MIGESPGVGVVLVNDEAALVNPRGALGLDAEGANQAQSFAQLGKIARRSGLSGLPQPRQHALSAPGADLKQLIEGLALLIGQSIGEPPP